VVSTPNKEIYSDRRNYRNPHHVKELYRDEFVAMVRAKFPEVALFGQRADAYSARTRPAKPPAASSSMRAAMKPRIRAM
jgi:hypothetical protein